MELIGLWSAFLMVAVILELKTIRTQILSVPIDRLVFETGFWPYIIGTTSWTLLLLIVGFVWTKILFPQRPWLEKIIFSFVAGTIIMALSFSVPFFLDVGGRVIAVLFGAGVPLSSELLFQKHVELFVNNQEQVYELANILVFLVLGLVILMVQTLAGQSRNKPSAV